MVYQAELGRFTDREIALAAFDRLLAEESSRRTLVYWGLSGQGKTTLLHHLAEGQGTRNRCALIDLDQLIAYDSAVTGSDQDLAGAILDSVAQVLLRWSRFTRWRRRRYEHSRAQARRLLAPPSSSVTAHMHAADDSAITQSAIHVDAGPVVRTADQAAYRAALVDGVCKLARGLRRRHGVLLIDTSERLRLLDEVAIERGDREAREVGIDCWFASQVLPRLLTAAPGLKVVLAGRESLDLPVNLVLDRVELEEWELKHTTEYLATCGLDAADLARTVHALCRGVPVWTALVAELAVHSLSGNEPVTSAWLAETAMGRPAEEWLADQFLVRLTPVQRRVVMASAVLRAISKEAVEWLLDGTELPTGWYERLCSYSFVRLIREPSGRAERRFHDLVRLALLAYLDREEPAYRDLLHQRAGTYFVEQAAFLEEAYHRFAIGDDTLVDAWQEEMETAHQDGDVDLILRHAEIIVAPEQIPRIFHRFPALAALAALRAGRIARDQGRLADARHLLHQAHNGYLSIGDLQGEADVLAALGGVAYYEARYDEAARLYEESLAINRAFGNKKEESHIVYKMGILILTRQGRSREAVQMLRHSRKLFRETGDSTCEGNSLRVLAQLELLTGKGRLRKIERLYTKAVELYRVGDHKKAEAEVQSELANILVQIPGYQSKAEKLYEQVAATYRDIKDRRAEAVALGHQGDIASRAGRYKEAERLWRQALTLFREGGMRDDEFYALHSLAVNASRAGQHKEAERLYRQVLALYREKGIPHGEAQVLHNLARNVSGVGWRKEANRLHRQAVVLYREIGMRDGEAITCTTWERLRGERVSIKRPSNYTSRL